MASDRISLRLAYQARVQRILKTLTPADKPSFASQVRISFLVFMNCGSESAINSHYPSGQISDIPSPITRDFTSTFRIGRADTCEIVVRHEYVSRQHVEAYFKDGLWWVEDLQSSNGRCFSMANKIGRAAIGLVLNVRLGVAWASGPIS